MSRLAIVGCEASGKTVLTASMADFFQPGKSRLSCSMVPENVAAHRFFEYTNYQMRTKHAWPQATNPDKTTVLQWSMRIDGTAVASMEMLDFGGEVFRAAFREGEPAETGEAAQGELLAYLSGAEFVVVTVSIGVLMRDLKVSQGLSSEDLARDSEAKWVTRGLLDFVRGRLPSTTAVVIVLTQADLYARELEEFGGPDGLFMKSWPTVAAVYPDIPIVAVSAVSDVDADGLPREGYSSRGILPLMNLFADYCVGGIGTLREGIKETLDTLRNAPEDTDPRVYRQEIQSYSDQVELFRVASGLSGDWYEDELNRHVNALVGIQDEVASKLRRLEAAGLAKLKAREEKRKQEEAAALKAQEEKRKAEEEAERKRQEEEARRLADERIKAEAELEKSKLAAEVEIERNRAVAKRNRTRAVIAAAAGLAVLSLCGLVYFIDNSVRTAEIETLKVQEHRREALSERSRTLSEAALSGDVSAAQGLLGMIERGEVQEADVNALYRIYMLLVNEGDARAMYRLGVACHRGTCGVKRSDFNAHWFLTMAEKNGFQSNDLDELIERTAAAKGDDQARSQGIDSLFADVGAATNSETAVNGPAEGKAQGGER